MFLDSTPLGVSLKTPHRISSNTILKGTSNVVGPEVKGAVERDDPAYNASRSIVVPVVQAGLDYSEKTRVLESWLNQRGWTLKWYTSGNYIDSATLDGRLVTVSSRQIPRHQYYSLLHECSHVDLLTGPPESRRGEPYGYLDLWYGEVNERTLRHRVAVVIDEINTWEHGIKIADELQLSVNRDLYRKFRDRNLKSYFEWAIDPREKNA